ncbi:MAG: ATP-binding protein [Treponema sp.]|nr:ATP-binding protein [Treponema sp.]
MLSVRGKTILVMLGIVLFITGSTLATGLFVNHLRFTTAAEDTLVPIVRIAARLLSSEIGRVKGEAIYMAEQVGIADGNVNDVLHQQLARHQPFLSLSIVNRESVTFHAGDPDAKPAGYVWISDYAQRAFAGETIITSTSHTPGKNLVMRLWAPIDDDRVLVATLPGLHLSEFTIPYTIWDAGIIFITDGTGTHVAGNRYHEWIYERRNYIELAMTHQEYQKASEFHQLAIENTEGFQSLEFSGRQMYSVFHYIPGTDNWSVIIIAPLTEKPFFHMRETLFISVAIIIILGIIAVVSTANIIAAPYEKMKELKRVAEVASNSKTQFLASMSHEMRTPLSAIISLSEMELANTKLWGDSFANIEKIYSAGTTMLGIINDLLDISRIEAGKLFLTPVVYDVPNMINDTIQLNIVRLGGKPVQFRLCVNEDIPVRLKGDELKVKQILSNLLSNAFKYTEAGSVEWSIFCAREGNRIKITSTIKDTGIGIRKEDFCKLFNDYTQVNARANYYVEGTGLGLSITKKLAELMGGSITLESNYLKGSSFTVEFFQEAAGDEVIGKDTATNLSQFRYSAQRHTQNQRLIRANMSYATVLVVDDVPSNLDIAEKMLKPYKINVETAASGSEAIALVRAERIRYDAIFMDHVMPGINGIQTTKAIRNSINSEYARTVPIIALTANILTGNDVLYLENGFQAFLSKPIDILRLDQVLNQWVRDREKEKDLPQETEQSEDEKTAEKVIGFLSRHIVPGLNLAAGIAYLQNDIDSYISVLRSFVKHTPGKIDNTRITIGNTDLYRIAAHSLKGSSKNIGATQLGELAEKLEKAAENGNQNYIRDNNPAFIEMTERLIANISAFLDAIAEEEPAEEKLEKERPDPEILRDIMRACEDYDMSALRKAVESLASFRYTACPDLAQWVTEQSNLSNFDGIQKQVLSILETLEMARETA